MKESSAFILRSSMNGSWNTTVGIPVLHVVGSSIEEPKIESHAVPAQGIVVLKITHPKAAIPFSPIFEPTSSRFPP